MLVLIVDDDPDVRLLLQLTVETLGHETVMASDASTGYAVCASCDPDAMLLDMSMPDGSGLTLLHQLRADGIEPPATVLVSAQTPTMLAAAAAELGLDFLSKPVRIEDLRTVLRGIHEQRTAPTAPTTV